MHEVIVDRALDINAGSGGAFLPLQAKGGAHTAQRGFVQVGGAADDDRIFAAHLGHDRARIAALGDGAQQAHAHVVGAGEGVAIDILAFGQGLAHGAARPGEVVEGAVGHAGIAEAFGQFPGGVGRVGGRFEDDGVASDRARLR